MHADLKLRCPCGFAGVPFSPSEGENCLFGVLVLVRVAHRRLAKTEC